MANGFAENTDVFPSPPVTVAAQNARITSVQGKINAVTQARAVLKAAMQDRDAEIELMKDEMSDGIEYASLTTDDDDAKMQLIGYSGRAEPQELELPGQTRLLEVVRQGAAWFHGDWKDPIGGGKVDYYKIMRREISKGGDMTEAGSSPISEATLVQQPRGVELEYVVIAVNKAGEGAPSNPITITL